MSLLPQSWLQVVAVATAISRSVVVSLDRVFLGVHFPSDVVAGALLGCLLTLVPWLGLSGLQDRFETPKSQ